MRTLVFPPPMSTKNLPEDVRRAMRAFERVHKMLEAKAAADRRRVKSRTRDLRKTRARVSPLAP